MQLAWAIVAAVGAAVGYGAATAGQHAAATGTRGLMALIRDPRWWAATAGDVAGMVLQIVALVLGPVTVVQPLLILALPVAIVLRPLFGSATLRRSDLAHCVILVVALSVFFVLIGDPGRGTTVSATAATVLTLIGVVGGAVVVAGAMRLAPVPRAAVFGAVAGCLFGGSGVLVEVVGTVVSDHGWHALAHPAGVASVIGLVVLAVSAYLLAQFGFQLGPIAASFPANLVVDPFVAVILGAAMLHEKLPLDPGRLVGYTAVLLIVSWSTITLAREPETSEVS
jgi:hypothetical protein